MITAPPYYPDWKIHPGFKNGWTKKIVNEATIFRNPIWIPSKKSGINRIFHLGSFAFSIMPSIVRHIFWKPDIIITIAPALTSAPIAWLLAKVTGAKSILHFQDLEIDAALKLGLLRSKSPIVKPIRWFEKKLISGFDQISTISEGMKRNLINKGISKDKIHIFPNWVDTDFIKPLDTNFARRSFQIPKEKFVILYSGNLGAKQGLEIIVQAAHLLQRDESIYFIICGNGVYKEELKKMAIGLSNILFLPLQPYEKLGAFLNTADVHLLPQKRGVSDLVMPSKLTGILASGKPVVLAAELDTESAWVVKDLGIVISPENVDELVEAIVFLKNNPHLRFKYGELGRQYAELHWSKKSVLSDFYRFLKSLL